MNSDEFEIEIEMSAFVPGRLSKSIRVMMDRQGITSGRKFAEHNGFAQPTFQAWLAEASPPNWKNLEKLASLYGLSFTEYIKYLRGERGAIGEEDEDEEVPSLDEIQSLANQHLTAEERKELIKRLVEDL